MQSKIFKVHCSTLMNLMRDWMQTMLFTLRAFVQMLAALDSWNHSVILTSILMAVSKLQIDI
jgi:hypothetical protein